MNGTRLDTLARSMATGSSRRRGLRGLSSTALVLATSRFVESADARTHHTHHKNHHQSHGKHNKKKSKPVVQLPGEMPPATPGPTTTADAFCPTAAPNVALGSARRFAQSFVALRSGQLTSASVNLVANLEGANFALEIRNVDVTGTPSDVLARTSIANVPAIDFFNDPPRTITGTFATPATVVAGQPYALAITGEPGNPFGVEGQQFIPCPDGFLFIDTDASETFQRKGAPDLVFATSVTA